MQTEYLNIAKINMKSTNLSLTSLKSSQKTQQSNSISCLKQSVLAFIHYLKTKTKPSPQTKIMCKHQNFPGV